MYDYVIKYRKGSTNHEADMLSRNPVSHHVIERVHLLTKTELAEKQGEINSESSKYEQLDGIWTVKKKGLVKVVVPKSLKLMLLEKTHQNYGHPGVKKMIAIISPEYYWVNIHIDIANYVKHCEVCQLNKKSHQLKFGSLGTLPPAIEPYDILSIDSVGGLGYYNSVKNYLHIVVDHATRYVWTFPSKSLTTETYTNLLKQIFNVQKPKMLLSDRHPSFTASKFRRFLERNGVKQLLTSSNRPQANGRNERINGVIMSRLRCKINEGDGKIPWTRLMSGITREYNDTPHAITRFAPSYLLGVSGSYESPIGNTAFNYPPLTEARRLAAERTEAEHVKSKARYDLKHKQPALTTGDIVKFETFRYPHTRKLSAIYEGPFLITKQRSEVLFEITRIDQTGQSIDDAPHFHLAHIGKLRKFFPRAEFKLQEE